MAVVNGPLFSLDASGAVGKAIVYTKWKGRNVVREYVTPANPRSIAQRGRRTWMALLNAIWAAMDSTDKDSWADLAAAGNYSNFNGFTSYNLDQQTIGNPPTKNRGDTPTTITTAYAALSSTPGTNLIEFAASITGGQAGTYGVILLYEGATVGTPSTLIGVAFFPAFSNGTQERTVTNLPAGTYSAEIMTVSNDGSIDDPSVVEENIVVTGV